MDVLLMLHGVTRWCGDCASETIFVPALESEEGSEGCLCCTACDAAVYVAVAA